MDLTRIKTLVDSKSYFSRSGVEVWAAINASARYIYQAVIKEQSGFWIKFDSTSLTLQPGVSMYHLPTDAQQLIRIRERQTATDQWRTIHNQSLTSDSMQRNAQSVGVSYEGESSQFSFYGPYLDAEDAESGVDTESIAINPAPADTRYVELVYSAQFVEVEDETSFLMIPEDGHDALIDFAVAECIKANDDTLASAYWQSGMTKMSLFLELCRNRQLQDGRTVEPYLD